MVDFKHATEKLRAQSALERSIADINRALAEPLAPPRRTKVRRLTKRLEPKEPVPHGDIRKDALSREELREALKEPRKPPRRLHTLVRNNARPPRVVRRKAAAAGAESTATGALVKLSELAKQADIQEQLARLWLRKAEIKRPGTRWQWEEGSRELARVRKVLGLT